MPWPPCAPLLQPRLRRRCRRLTRLNRRASGLHLAIRSASRGGKPLPCPPPECIARLTGAPSVQYASRSPPPAARAHTGWIREIGVMIMRAQAMFPTTPWGDYRVSTPMPTEQVAGSGVRQRRGVRSRCLFGQSLLRLASRHCQRGSHDCRSRLVRGDVLRRPAH